MKTPVRTLSLITLSATALLLSACGDKTDGSDHATAGQRVDSFVEQSRQAADEARQSTEETAQQVKSDTKEIVDTVEKKAEQAGSAIDRKLDAAGQRASDAMITAQVKAKLAAADDLKALDINVDTEGGHLTLQGSAPSAAARDHATALARSVEGVASVENKLMVE
jgi:osmotically-inducible protein OsmY